MSALIKRTIVAIETPFESYLRMFDSVVGIAESSRVVRRKGESKVGNTHQSRARRGRYWGQRVEFIIRDPH